MSVALVHELLRPEVYPHEVLHVELRETHISWVFLTGQYAYKLKKPVDLGFVNFQTLALRKSFCEEEIRRNRQYAPDLYLETVPISLCGDRVKVGYPGQPIDYVVKMRQFDDSQLARNLVDQDQLTETEILNLARDLAEFHRTAQPLRDGMWGTPDTILQDALENIRALRQFSNRSDRMALLDRIEAWTRCEMKKQSQLFSKRRSEGFVRECHGDLHLGNIVRWQGKLVPFDCIEFNPDFYWIDVINEVAFLVMDLEDHGRRHLAWRFFNGYLESTGDYEGAVLLRYYMVYRAMVRAKVGQLQCRQTPGKEGKTSDFDPAVDGYLAIADRNTRSTKPFLAITHGMSGSGKSYGTRILAEQPYVIRIRSDSERRRLFPVPTGMAQRPEAPREPPGIEAESPRDDLYSTHARDRVYQRLLEVSKLLIQADFSVVVDATFLKRCHRRSFQALATHCQTPFFILPFHARADVLKSRIQQRTLRSEDVSEATESVLEEQMRALEPLEPEEMPWVRESPLDIIRP